MRFFCLTCASRSLACFTRGDGFTVVRLLTCRDHHRLGSIGFFLANACQGGVNCILIFFARLDGGLLMTLLTGRFFTFQPCLTCFKARFGFCCTFFFHGDGINFGLLLAEVLHQRNIAWADPGAGAAFDAVGQVMCFGFIV